MPSSVRPRGGSASNRSLPVTPMSERQQLALLMQMTSTNNEAGSRSPSSSSSSRARERNERGWTPLHEACNHGWYDVAFRLVQSGANVNAKGLDNDTPLHDAAINGHIKLVKLLVEKGADIHAKNSKGKTPLDVAPSNIEPYLLNPSLPISESTASTRVQPRSRDEKKINESNKSKQLGSSSADETMDSSKASSNAEDVYEFKSVKESDSSSPDQKSSDTLELETDVADPLSIPTSAAEESTSKRNFVDVCDNGEESANDEESRKKKRKDDGSKEGKGGSAQRSTGPNKGQSGKQSSGGQGKLSTLNVGVKSSVGEKKSPCSSPKPAGSSSSDVEVEDGKTDLKVPPLKIVIPQSSSGEQETTSRNGKNSSQRTHQALPYVVASSNSNDANEMATTASPDAGGPVNSKGEDNKKDGNGIGQGDGDQKGSSHQRVLRSSHRSGTSQGTDRGSNNSSPQLQRSHSPSPTASPAAASSQADASSTGPTPTTTSKSSDTQVAQTSDQDIATSSTSTSSTPVPSVPPPVELHPRKRKMKPSKEATAPQEAAEAPAEAQIHPHDQPITNCYQLFLDIRKQINKRRKGLFPVQPKPPQGFKDYLMNRCTYVLSSTAPNTPNISYPPNLQAPMKDLFSDQEKERYRLKMQHVIEKEKLVLSVEQEILRVHGRAARALANQSLPFSVCTILKDEEVYNLITPEQEEKDRNARSRYNGRLFLSWLQDVDDKWEKIKEHMLLRHHNEAESLYAVQKMDWEWKMKELNLCDRKSTPSIDEHHVPMVHVSDDFDLLPA